MHPGVRLAVTLAVFGGFLSGCHPACTKDPSEDQPRQLTIEQIEGLRSLEEVLPVPSDTVAERYRRYDRTTFYATYRSALADVSRLIDSLNTHLPPHSRVDTLSIDHTIEGFGDAASAGKTLYISSSYFYLFPGTSVLRSVVFHEFGHIHARLLDSISRAELIHIWSSVRSTALFYLFRDGEYSGNARFGGHPEDSPEELFASGFNLFQNQPDEIAARLRFVDSRHRDLVEQFRSFISRNAL
jgi:hypothetical protein